jgi:hypothetical protein
MSRRNHGARRVPPPTDDGQHMRSIVRQSCTKCRSSQEKLWRILWAIRAKKKELLRRFFRCESRRFVGRKRHEVRGTSARERKSIVEAATGAAARRTKGDFGPRGSARRASPGRLLRQKQAARSRLTKARELGSNASAEAACQGSDPGARAGSQPRARVRVLPRQKAPRSVLRVAFRESAPTAGLGRHVTAPSAPDSATRVPATRVPEAPTRRVCATSYNTRARLPSSATARDKPPSYVSSWNAMAQAVAWQVAARRPPVR